jgi:hypothetical protein
LAEALWNLTYGCDTLIVGPRYHRVDETERSEQSPQPMEPSEAIQRTCDAWNNVWWDIRMFKQQNDLVVEDDAEPLELEEEVTSQ